MIRWCLWRLRVFWMRKSRGECFLFVNIVCILCVCCLYIVCILCVFCVCFVFVLYLFYMCVCFFVNFRVMSFGSSVRKCAVMGNFMQGLYESNMCHISHDHQHWVDSKTGTSFASLHALNSNFFWRLILKQYLQEPNQNINFLTLTTPLRGCPEIKALLTKFPKNLTTHTDPPPTPETLWIPRTNIQILGQNRIFLINVTESHAKPQNFGNYTNLGEAEYCVGLFMFLRLQGVRPEHISVLTPFSAQKRLLKQILKKKCGWHDSFGMPACVKTVNSFKSDSNCVVILSLAHFGLGDGLGTFFFWFFCNF